MSGAHAFLAPSAAARWVRCPLAPSLEAAFPETEPSPSALEGQAAHWVVQTLMQGAPVDVGQLAPNGIAVTQEMIEGAHLVIFDIAETLGVDWRRGLLVEQPVHIPRVHPTHNWGTPDYRAWKPARENGNGLPCLHIWDYKFGWGVVEALENWQLIDYVAGILDEAGIDGLQDQSVVVDMRIVQPRAPHKSGPVRSWRVLASDLRAPINQLMMAAAKATGPNPPACPTVEGCADCKGRHACEALQREAFRAADLAVQYGRVDLSPFAMGLEARTLRRAQRLLEARITGLDAQIEATIKAGTLVPFWSLENAPGRLAWTVPVQEAIAYGEMLGLDLRKPQDAITPTQAKALAKSKKLPESLFDAFASRPAGAVKLVPDDGTKAALIFNQK